jgi:glycosyltransferase involved in cell wall biosynthesis
MRIVLFSSYAPFINGGARFIVESLERQLLDRGYLVERVYLPCSDFPEDLLGQMMAYRSIRIEGADRVICFRPPSHLLQHPNKVLWFIHHFRVFYDLWNTHLSPPHTHYNEALRCSIFHADRRALTEARRIFTNSRAVQARLKHFNDVDSSVLYPPLLNPSDYRNTGYGDEIVYISRLVSHKRQHLLIEAMAHVQSGAMARVCGESDGPVYAEDLSQLASKLGVSDRVSIENRWISEEEKRDILGRSLAVAYFPLDEDSYGYVSLEAAHSCKPILTATDSGGVLEFVVHERNGLVCEPEPKAIATSIDRLYQDRKLAQRLGTESEQRIKELQINWDNVIGQLLT